VKNKGEVLIYTSNKTPPLFFTWRKLRPPGMENEATAFLSKFVLNFSGNFRTKQNKAGAKHNLLLSAEVITIAYYAL